MDKKRYLVPHQSRPLSISAMERMDGDELIFFIHGLGCAKEAFTESFTFPGLKKYSLLVPDLPGFGESSKVKDFSYSMEEHARICLELIDNFPHEKIHIVGHSMGGVIGLLLANLLKGRLTSFINIEGNLTATDCSMSSMVNSSEMREYRQRMINHLAAASNLLHDQSIALWHHWVQKSGSVGLYQSARSLVEWSCSDKLIEMFEKMKGRKLYIHGERNSSIPALKQMKNIPIATIPKSGHFPMSDNPGHLYQTIEDFLK